MAVSLAMEQQAVLQEEEDADDDVAAVGQK
jgi:hypothetical protein